MKWLIWILNQPFPAHVALRYRLQVTLGFSLFITLFMLFFQPVELPLKYRNWIIMGYGIICFVIMGIDMMVVPAVFKEHVKEGNWKVYKHLLGTLWLFMTSTCAVLLFNYLLGISDLTLANFFFTLGKIISLTIIPATIAILILYNYDLRANLLAAERLQNALDKKIQRWNNKVDDSDIVLTDNSEQEVLNLRQGDLLMIRSADNYAMIYWREQGKIKKTLLRQTMKFLEDQLCDHTRFFRCHRTSIVNLGIIRQVKGNMLECRLILEGVREEVPVSREKRKQLQHLLLSTHAKAG